MKILVWLSGWVDSAVSAYLLKKAGHEVHAGFMINYLSDDDSCPTKIDIEVAREVAAFLDIPFFTFDYREAYEKRIIQFIYNGYARGLTPNPDVLCNNLIKFDLFAEEAKEFWYEAIATGHYARILHSQDGKAELLKGIDPSKDQSYFLSRLSQEQLQYALFPIGHLKKTEVRSIAQEAKLPNADRKDSQWLCFIGKVSMREFLAERIPLREWPIFDISGKRIGTHSGAQAYTIGQRRWIELWGGPALFVVAKDVANNSITVGPESALQLFQNQCRWVDWHTISGETVENGKYSAKIRYRQADESCMVEIQESEISVTFERPQRAIAPGQFIVIYSGDHVIWSAYMTL